MSKSIYDVVTSLTKEIFKVGSDNMPEAYGAGVEYDYQSGSYIQRSAGVGKEYINPINTLQQIKAMTKFLYKFGDTICVMHVVESDFTMIEYSPVRYNSENRYYNENGSDVIVSETAPDKYIGPIEPTYMHNLLMELNPTVLGILRDNVPEGIVSQEEWQAAEILVQKYQNLNKFSASLCSSNKEQINKTEELPAMLIDAATKMDKLVHDNDVVIFVGNTPQMIRYPFDRITFQEKPNLYTTSLAISGHPGKVMEHRSFIASLKNILLDDQHELYKKYMQDMGLTPKFLQDKKIHFVDCVGAGVGISYLMKCLAEIVYEGDVSEAQKHFHVISTNKKAKAFEGNALVGDKFCAGGFTTDTTSLEMNALTSILDRVSDDSEAVRLMPSSQSYKWSPTFMSKLNEASYNIFKQNNDKFAKIFTEIDHLHPGVDVVFARAVKCMLSNRPDLDAKKVASILAENFSGKVFSEEHKDTWSTIGGTDDLWDIFSQQADITGNPGGFLDLAGTLCSFDLDLLSPEI